MFYKRALTVYYELSDVWKFVEVVPLIVNACKIRICGIILATLGSIFECSNLGWLYASTYCVAGGIKKGILLFQCFALYLLRDLLSICI